MEHKPVMSKEIVSCLDLAPGKVVLDCTVGMGGHSALILPKILPGGRLIAMDRDEECLEYARRRLQDLSPNISFIHNDFRNFDRALDIAGVDKVDAMLFDLGVCSLQLDTPERGFSIKRDAPLDMRMDRSSYISAYDLVNNLTESEISSILRTFGQERWHNRIARYLVRAREQEPIATTGQLTAVVLKAMPRGFGYQRIHPATRTFQAFRIAVNRELESLDEALLKAVDYLSPGGKICVISFHSLEDRVVKNVFRGFCHQGKISLVHSKPLVPSGEEISENPRSRSAKLRVAQLTSPL
ncbi:MAG: 16S rRNA (cytosine(1402)-N(4))-methyltransferase RsmH [Candidatus Omnitrophota bacterium]